MRNGKRMAWKTINHAAFSVLQRWQIYPNIAPFVLPLIVRRYPLSVAKNAEKEGQQFCGAGFKLYRLTFNV
jgi:hypothetical protein